MSDAQTEVPDQVKAAIRMAKAFFWQAFEGENVENVDLEEVQPPEYDDTWQVTFGFNRRRDPVAIKQAGNLLTNNFLQAAAIAAIRPQRIYKLVKVDLTGSKPPSITNRKED